MLTVQGLVHTYKIFSFRYVLVVSARRTRLRGVIRYPHSEPQEMELFWCHLHTGPFTKDCILINILHWYHIMMWATGGGVIADFSYIFSPVFGFLTLTHCSYQIWFLVKSYPILMPEPLLLHENWRSYKYFFYKKYFSYDLCSVRHRPLCPRILHFHLISIYCPSALPL